MTTALDITGHGSPGPLGGSRFVLIRSLVPVGNPPICLHPLSMGDRIEHRYTFHPDWCEQFLEGSGDTNNELHSTSGLGILQGLAIFAAVNVSLSICMHGFKARKIIPMTFRGELSVGDSVVVTLECLTVRGTSSQIRVCVLDDDGREVTAPMTAYLFDAR